MADSLDILVRTTGDGSGADKVVTSLDNVKASADKAGVSIETAFNKNAGLATKPGMIPDAPTAEPVPLTMEGVAAIEKTIVQLEKKIEVTGALGKDTTQLTAALDKLNAALRTEDALAIKAARSQFDLAESQKKATAEASREAEVTANTAAKKINAEATKELTEQNKNLRNVAQAVAIEIPFMGRVLNLLTSPTSAVVGGFALLIGIWKKTIDACDEVIVKFQEFRKPLQEQEDLMQKATSASDAFNISLNSISKGEDPLTKRFAEREAAIRSLIQAQIELESKEKAIAYLKIEQDFERSKQTPDDRQKMLQAKAAVDVAFVKKQSELKAQAEEEAAQREADDLAKLEANIATLLALKTRFDSEKVKLENDVRSLNRRQTKIASDIDTEKNVQKELSGPFAPVTALTTSSPETKERLRAQPPGKSLEEAAGAAVAKSISDQAYFEKSYEQNVKEIRAKNQAILRLQNDTLKTLEADLTKEKTAAEKLKDAARIRGENKAPLDAANKGATGASIQEIQEKLNLELLKLENERTKLREKEESEKVRTKKQFEDGVNSGKPISGFDDSGLNDQLRVNGETGVNLHNKTLATVEATVEQLLELSKKLDATNARLALVGSTVRESRKDIA